jgi:hypothetical protein
LSPWDCAGRATGDQRSGLVGAGRSATCESEGGTPPRYRGTKATK